jgi:hypothetical protein
MRGNIYGRLERLEGCFLRSNPETEAREEHFRRCAAILDVLADHSPLKGRNDLDRLIEQTVSLGLLEYGLSGEEVRELAPAYVEHFEELFRDAEEGGGASYGRL